MQAVYLLTDIFMKKWIKFKFKNNLWLYFAVLVVILGLFSLLAIVDGEIFIGVSFIAVACVAFVGAWFGNHYGIKVTENNYTLVCNATIKKIAKKDLVSLNVYFIKTEYRYEIYAEAMLDGGETFEFYWLDLHSTKGGKLKLGVTDENLQNLITQLEELEKVYVQVITD